MTKKMKRTNKILFLLLLVPLAALQAASGPAVIQPTNLRCEYLTNPLGIDELQPRLSWVLETRNPAARGLRQSAYQILVAASPASLAENKGDIWDSGKVDSDETVGIAFAGKVLQSRDECHWKVRVWDQDGRMSEWSRSARWSMGLLSSKDWKAKWITLPSTEPQTTAHFGYQSTRAKSPNDVKWEFAGDDAVVLGAQAKSPDEVKWVQIDLGGSTQFDEVKLWPAWPMGRYTVPGSGFPIRFKIETANRDDFSDARLIVDRTMEDLSNPGKEPMLLSFTPVSGRFVRLTTVKLSGWGWPVWDTALSGWRTDLLNESPMLALAEMEVLRGKANLALGKPVQSKDAWDDDPEASAVINAETLTPVRHGGWSRKFLTDGRTDADLGSRFHFTPVSLLRREFVVGKPVRRATLYASAMGCYEFRINGARVGDDPLAPSWTIYSKRVLYQTHDVTAQLKSGANVLGAMLADGWFRMRGWDFSGSNKRFTGFFNADDRWLIGQLEVEYADGSRQIIGTDASWKGRDDGPIRRTSMDDGAHYDSRKELPDWDQPGRQVKSGWRPVVERSQQTTPVLSAQMMPPIHIAQEHKPRNRTEPQPGMFVYDFGEQITGVCRVRLDGPAGTTVRLRYGEAAQADGSVYVANLIGNYDNEDVFILDGRGPKTITPSFTYHGFQYVEVRGLPSANALQEITALRMGSDLIRTTTLATSDKRLNRLNELIERSYRSSIFGLLFNGAGRDERYPWMGDIYNLEGHSLTTLFDYAAFGANAQRVVLDAQNADGLTPEILMRTAPENMTATAGWSEATVMGGYPLWLNYGDCRILEASYPGARNLAAWIERGLKNDLPGSKYIAGYNDWVNASMTIPPGATAWEPKGGKRAPNMLCAASWAAYTCNQVANMATALHKTDDAKHFSAVADRIRAALIKTQVKPDGTVGNHQQSSYALVLGMGHLHGELGLKADARLLDAIRAYQEHIGTGSVGTTFLLNYLSDHGHHDLAYRMVMQPTVPSYGAIVDMGASVLSERLDSRHPTLGINPHLMNCLNHLGFTKVQEWIFGSIVGIRPDLAQPGYKHFFMAPKLGGGLTSMKAGYESVRGHVECAYEVRDGALTLSVTVPPNTTASVMLPARKLDNVSESGRSVVQAKGVQIKDASSSIVRLESGNYRFVIPQGEYQ
jgi:alpha-L-rhamnosidase